jgi:hypothetical protein
MNHVIINLRVMNSMNTNTGRNHLVAALPTSMRIQHSCLNETHAHTLQQTSFLAVEKREEEEATWGNRRIAMFPRCQWTGMSGPWALLFTTRGNQALAVTVLYHDYSRGLDYNSGLPLYNMSKSIKEPSAVFCPPLLNQGQ